MHGAKQGNYRQDPARDRASFYGPGWDVGYDDQGRVRLSHSGAFDLGAATSVNAAGLSAVSFSIGADQKAASVVVENLEVDGEGTFTRVR